MARDDLLGVREEDRSVCGQPGHIVADSATMSTGPAESRFIDRLCRALARWLAASSSEGQNMTP